jgi:hypothetical protein
MKPKHIFASVALVLVTFFLFSFSEKNLQDKESPETLDFLQQLKPYTDLYGEVETGTVVTVKKEEGKLLVTTGSVKGKDTFNKYIMVADDRDSKNPTRTIYLWETDLPINATQEEKVYFTGYLNLTELGSGATLAYQINKGVKTRVNNKEFQQQRATPTHWDCVKGCVNKTMDNMGWGETILCAIAFPECCAGVFLACEIDCTIK